MVQERYDVGGSDLKRPDESTDTTMAGVWSLVGYVKRDKCRMLVVQRLGQHVMMPRDLAGVSGIRIGHVSRALRQLRSHDLVECVNPTDTVGRLYRLTADGIEVFKKLEQVYTETEVEDNGQEVSGPHQRHRSEGSR